MLFLKHLIKYNIMFYTILSRLYLRDDNLIVPTILTPQHYHIITVYLTNNKTSYAIKLILGARRWRIIVSERDMYYHKMVVLIISSIFYV